MPDTLQRQLPHERETNQKLTTGMEFLRSHLAALASGFGLAISISIGLGHLREIMGMAFSPIDSYRRLSDQPDPGLRRHPVFAAEWRHLKGGAIAPDRPGQQA